nr:unnamed protein product [Spirometra erinaceieuropaei]
MIRQLHDGMMTPDTDNDAISAAFAVTNGMKQGYVLAPTLSSLMLLPTLMVDAYRDEHPGISIAYRTDGHLLNSMGMQARARLSTTTIHDLLLADDYALNTLTKVHMQRSRDLFASGCDHFGLTINTNKRGVMYQPPTNAEYNSPPITLSRNHLQTVDKFAYLPITLLRNTHIHNEVLRRLSKASQNFSRLQVYVSNYPRPSIEHQTEDVQGRRLDNASLLNGGMHPPHKPCQAAQLRQSHQTS